MVKRKSSEVLITGDKVDPRYKTSAPLADDDPMKAATRVGTSADLAAQRIRKRPSVIDGTNHPAVSRKASGIADLASLEEDLGMAPTAKPGEAAVPSPSAKVALSPTQGQTWAKDKPSQAPDSGKTWKDDTGAQKTASGQAWKEDKPSQKSESGQAWEENKRSQGAKSDQEWEEAERSKKADSGQAWTEAAQAPTPVPTPLSAAPKVAEKPEKTAPKKPKPASPKELSKQKAASAVTSMVGQMKARAQTNGGFLRTEDISAMEQEFQAQVSQLADSLEQSFEAYVDARERAEWDSAREFPFGRVVVKKFAHLFKEPREGRLDTVSKRMLPGFFMGLNMMIGPESVDLFQERCRRVVESIREQDGDDFDWDSVYASPEINAVVIDALMAIAPHFENFERRQDWFIELVNAHLTPVGEHELDAGWELSQVGYRRFLAALFKEVHGLLGSDAARERLSRRYGSNAVEAVNRLMARAEA